MGTTFADIVGQDQIKQQLQKNLTQKKTPFQKQRNSKNRLKNIRQRKFYAPNLQLLFL